MNSYSEYLKQKYVVGPFLLHGIFYLDFSSGLEQLRVAASEMHGSTCNNKWNSNALSEKKNGLAWKT